MLKNMVLITCLKIFFVRILDVSLGTFRTILVVKGKKLIASIIGFIEVAIWFMIVREALNTADNNFWIVIAYAGGFASGTYIGSFISEHFIEGNFGVQVITNKEDLVKFLRDNGYGVSVIDIKGHDIEQEKYMLFIEINKKKFDHLKTMIKKYDPKAFIVVNETKYVQNGYFR
ncbi:MAG: DUF2179 domain-containing protein [Mollicutes bacterium]|nr:DUF2179 domain-containing protein [Mollicutes bacterium]